MRSLHFIFFQILIFFVLTHLSSSFPYNINSTIRYITERKLFNDKEEDRGSYPDIFFENIYKSDFRENDQKKLRRYKRELQTQNADSINQNDNFELQEESEQEESESKNLNRFKRNENSTKDYNLELTTQVVTKKTKRNREENDRNSRDLRQQVEILQYDDLDFPENNDQKLNSNQNKRFGEKIEGDSEVAKNLEFNVKEDESEKEFEEKIARKIDALKEEIKREVDERKKIKENKRNSVRFNEIQNQMYESGCCNQDCKNGKSIKKRSLRKKGSNKRKRCSEFANHQHHIRENQKINSSEVKTDGARNKVRKRSSSDNKIKSVNRVLDNQNYLVKRKCAQIKSRRHNFNKRKRKGLVYSINP